MPDPGGALSFLSYSRKDAEAAEALWQALGQAGIEAFLDRRNLRPGDRWPERIDEQIRTCERFVLIWSAHADSSDHVKDEWNMAKALKRPIVPVLIDDTPPPPWLADRHYIEWRGDADAEVVARQIAKSACVASAGPVLAREATTGGVRRRARGALALAGFLLAGGALVFELARISAGAGRREATVIHADGTRSNAPVVEGAGPARGDEGGAGTGVAPSTAPATDRASKANAGPRPEEKKAHGPSSKGVAHVRVRSVSGVDMDVTLQPGHHVKVSGERAEDGAPSLSPTTVQVSVGSGSASHVTVQPEDEVTITYAPRAPSPLPLAPNATLKKLLPKPMPAENHDLVLWPELRNDELTSPLVDEIGDYVRHSDRGKRVMSDLTYLQDIAAEMADARKEGLQKDMQRLGNEDARTRADISKQLHEMESAFGGQPSHRHRCDIATRALIEALKAADPMSVTEAYRQYHQVKASQGMSAGADARRVFDASGERHINCGEELRLEGDRLLVTEVYVATGRFDEALRRLRVDLESDRPAFRQAGRPGLRVLEAVALVGLGRATEARESVRELARQLFEPEYDFDIWRSFYGVRNLIRNDPRFARDRAWLGATLDALEMKNRGQVIRALNALSGR